MPAPRRHVDRAATFRRNEGEAIGREDLRPEVKRAQHSGLRVDNFGAAGAKIAERRVRPGRFIRESCSMAGENAQYPSKFRGISPQPR